VAAFVRCGTGAWTARAVLAVAIAVLPANGWAQPPQHAAIASAHPLATRAGHQVLAAGGNAFDAAVAVSATLSVVEPYSSGLGGGGFWLLRRASDGHEVMVDGRERAPLAARRDMYLDADGEVVAGLSLDGPLAAGIPGSPAALALIAQRYGRLPLSASLATAVRLAREGFPVTELYRRQAQRRLDALTVSPAADVLLDAGQIPDVGQPVRQPALAATLEALARRGHDGFYRGPVAAGLVADVRAAGGIWAPEDLEAYRALEREPVRGEYRGMRVVSASPPSSGGIVLIEMLNILSGLELDRGTPVERTHLLVEAMRRAYRDRARHLGDPDFVRIDVPLLLSPGYAAGLRESIGPRATPSGDLPGYRGRAAGRDTTHLSVIDREGNLVAATLSINYPFGSGYLSPATGVLLNNEMDDFSVKPGVANVYGLVGAEANAVAPGKRPLSSMSPTFLETGGRVVALGTPGGSRIITMVLLAAMDVADGVGGVEDWVARPRFHHQYLPDQVVYEPQAFDAVTAAGLLALGHRLSERERGYGNMQAVVWNKGTGEVDAASDPRGEGQAIVR
jgi:gamma-glutamyltranspeptidase/glutathione hydrolase